MLMNNFRGAIVPVFVAFGLLGAAPQGPQESRAPAQTEPQPQPASPSGPESFPDVVARVNDTEIEKTELIRRAELLRAQLPEAAKGPDFYHRVLENMVGAELLFQSAAANGLVPTDAQVEEELSSTAERFGGEDAFQSALAEQGLGLDDVRGDLRRDMGVQKVIDEKIAATIDVPEEEKRRFYDENPESMQRPEQFKVAHILIRVEEEASEEEKAEARTKAQSLRGMVEAGQDFADLARRNSDDPGSKDSGGELPWMSEGQTVPPFESAARALAPGELSEVVETEFGFHVIKMVDRRAAGTTPYEDVHERIGEFLRQQYLQQRVEAEVERLRQQGQVEVFI